MFPYMCTDEYTKTFNLEAHSSTDINTVITTLLDTNEPSNLSSHELSVFSSDVYSYVSSHDETDIASHETNSCTNAASY